MILVLGPEEHRRERKLAPLVAFDLQGCSDIGNGSGNVCFWRGGGGLSLLRGNLLTLTGQLYVLSSLERGDWICKKFLGAGSWGFPVCEVRQMVLVPLPPVVWFSVRLLVHFLLCS